MEAVSVDRMDDLDSDLKSGGTVGSVVAREGISEAAVDSLLSLYVVTSFFIKEPVTPTPKPFDTGESDLKKFELVSLRNRDELDSLLDKIEVFVSDLARWDISVLLLNKDEFVLLRRSPRKNGPGERGLSSPSLVGWTTSEPV